jgi:hypothetical protein
LAIVVNETLLKIAAMTELTQKFRNLASYRQKKSFSITRITPLFRRLPLLIEYWLKQLDQLTVKLTCRRNAFTRRQVVFESILPQILAKFTIRGPTSALTQL